jgi:hypothetical protein
MYTADGFVSSQLLLPDRENFATGDWFVGVIGIAGNTDRIVPSAASLESSGGKTVNLHLVWRRADASTKARKAR